MIGGQFFIGKCFIGMKYELIERAVSIVTATAVFIVVDNRDSVAGVRVYYIEYDLN